MTRAMRSALALVILTLMFCLIFLFGTWPAAEEQARLHRQNEWTVINLQR